MAAEASRVELEEGPKMQAVDEMPVSLFTQWWEGKTGKREDKTKDLNWES